MARLSAGVPRPENPLRETAFAALHRATRELSIQRKIRLLPTIAGVAMFAILVMTMALIDSARTTKSRVQSA